MSSPFPTTNISLDAVCTAYSVNPKSLLGLAGKLAYNSDGSFITIPSTGMSLDLFRGRYATAPGPAPSPAGTGSWAAFASSSDGTKLVTGSVGGKIYTSTDSGVNWVQRDVSGVATGQWAGFASDLTGTKLVTGSNNGGKIYTSTDSGVNWVQRDVSGVPTGDWNGFATSSDGTKLVTGNGNNGYIYTSTDSGVSWVQRDVSGVTGFWNDFASSSDGIKLVAVRTAGGGNNIYTSTDSGVNWVRRDVSGNLVSGIVSVASSSDGTKLVTGFTGGKIFTSTDSGASWVQRDVSGVATGQWAGFASDLSGIKLVTGNQGGYIYTSTDSGVTWVQRNVPGNITGLWFSFASSSDGTKLVTGNVDNGYIYTSTDSGVTWRASDTIAPLAPNTLTSSAVATTGFTISWIGATGAMSYTSAISPNAGTYLATITSAGSGYVVYSGLTVGTPYSVTITAVNTWGSTPSTATSFSTTPPPAGLGNRRSIASDSTGRYLVTGVISNYIYTSTDYGVTWKAITALGTGVWLTFASDSTGSTLINAVTSPSGIIRRSVNYGDTWTQTSTFQFINIVSNSTGSIYIATNSSFGEPPYRSTDGGVTWTQIGGVYESWFLSAINSTGSYAATVSNRVVYVSTNSDTPTAGSVVFTSVFDGNTLSPVIAKWYDVKFNSTGNNLFLAGSVGNDPNVNTLYKGVLSGGVWTFSSVYSFNGLYNRGLKIVCNSTGTRIIAVGVDSTNVLTIVKSTDSGSSWDIRLLSSIPITGSRVIHDFKSNSTGQHLYLLIESTYIYTSTDYGETWRASDTIAPLAPNTLTSSAVATTGFTISWIGATGANSYTSVISPNAGTYVVTITSGGSGEIVYTGLSSGTPYTVTITAINEWGTAVSVPTSVTISVPATAPGAPTGVSATPGNAAATVYWTAPVSNGGSAITGYTVTPSTGSPVTVGNVLLTTLTGLTNGTSYTFTVIAINVIGNSLASSASSAVTPSTNLPGAPTGVSATPGYSSATVRWTAPASSGGSAITGYTVTPSVGTPVTVGNVLTTSVTGLTNGTQVTFTVKATNSFGNSAASSPSTAVTLGFKANWAGIASSSDGTKIVAGVAFGYIYTSTDSGVNLVRRDVSGNIIGLWVNFASSSDGTKLVTGNRFNGYIYTSTDSGASWVERSVPTITTASWSGFASSSDGTKLVAGVLNGKIYTSIDSGVNWVQRDVSGNITGNWNGFASSSDGTKLVTGNSNNGYIYTSTNSGATWTQRSPPNLTTGYWYAFASSSDGTKLVTGNATIGGGYIYTSTNSGVTWTQQSVPTVLTGAWIGFASSSDGTKLITGNQNNGGYIYTSTNSGGTWIQRSVPFATTGVWNKFASSSDGTKLFAPNYDNSFMYTSTDSGVTWNIGAVTVT